jgi:RNA polymerase sporulation-specific sigma factor
MPVAAADLDARNAFVEENMGLVHHCAKRMQIGGQSYDDLVQAGAVGLIKAANGFDAGRGLAFSTYAVPYIFGEMKLSFRRDRAVSVGRTMAEKARQIAAARTQLTEENGCEPSLRTLSAYVEMEAQEVAMLLGAMEPIRSLSAQNEDNSTETDVPIESEEAALTDKMALRQELARLQENERELILLRYFKNLTQAQTAKLMGMTQVQVSRKERKIMEKLRRDLRT